MKFLKWLGFSVLLLVALYLFIPLFLSNTFHVERSVVIEKNIDLVFQTACDMNIRSQWDPWLKMDPDAEIIMNIQPKIIGSGYNWKGNIIGEGKLTILEFEINKKIKSEIEFISPRNLKSDIIWTFKENKAKDKITITWTFKGNLSYPTERWYGLFMDKSLGEQFENGLNNFKKLVEKLPDLVGRTGEIKEVHFDGLIGLSIKDKSSIDLIVGSMLSNYISLRSYFRRNKIKPNGSPFTYYQSVNEDYSTIIFNLGFPTKQKYPGNEKIEFTEIPSGKAVMASHYGHFKTVKKTHDAIYQYILDHNLKRNGPHWEIYITDPLKEPNQSKWETQIYFPIK